MTIIFPYYLASYNEMTHTQTPPGNQSESKTSCLDSHKGDKQDSKALSVRIEVGVKVTVKL